MKKTVNLNGERFTVLNPSTMKAYQYSRGCYNGDHVWNVYGRCSDTKVRIDNYWTDFVRSTRDGWNCHNYSVLSHNCMFFTCGFEAEYKGHGYVTYITSAHQYIIPSSEEGYRTLLEMVED